MSMMNDTSFLSLINGSNCSQAGGDIPILVNNTGTRVCAIQSLNSDLLKNCCDGNDVHTYGCTSYCSNDRDLNDFTKCINQHGGNDTQKGVSIEDIFCQKNITGSITESVKSSAGFRNASTPRYSYLLLVLVLGYFFSDVSAAIIPSLSTGLERRATSDSSTCKIESIEQKNYVTLRNHTQQVTADFSCDAEDFCSYGTNINTGLGENNRTINGTSAAEPMYDPFFDLLQNMTGRMFPAMSSTELWHDWNVMGGKSFHLGFTPYAWCMTGTVSGCQGVLGDNNGTMTVEACGPLFASDMNGSGDNNDNATIQGVIAPIQLM